MNDVIKVGMADLKFGKNPIKLTTLGLGSCVGVVIYDKINGISGLAHVMLPDSANFNNITNESKFCDLALRNMVEGMERQGARRRNMLAKIAGGAKMFAFRSAGDGMSVGDKNVEAARNNLRLLGIRIVAEDVGLDYGRTILFDSTNEQLLVRSMGRNTKII